MFFIIRLSVIKQLILLVFCLYLCLIWTLCTFYKEPTLYSILFPKVFLRRSNHIFNEYQNTRNVEDDSIGETPVIPSVSDAGDESIRGFNREMPSIPILSGDGDDFSRENTVSPFVSKNVNCNPIVHRFFPLCKEKFQYIQRTLQALNCLTKTHQVNGTKCSILRYLTKVEPFCVGERELYKSRVLSAATLNYDVNNTLNLLAHANYKWMRGRVKLMWPSWVEAANRFSLLNLRRRRLNVVLFMGAFWFEPVFYSWAGKGGPLGELVQWSDLISGLSILGYNITIMQKPEDLSMFVTGDDKCTSNEGVDSMDIFYTDIMGVIHLKNKFGYGALSKYKCMLRVLDSFGTYPEFNYPSYPYKIPKGRSQYGNLNILTPQFLTLYPHTHDNNFLGFVVRGVNNSKTAAANKNVALLYGKSSSYLKGKERYIRIVSEYFKIHATSTTGDGKLPSFIHNHGPVSTARVQELLFEAKLFIGLGFPYEGPGPMEAMAAGAVFLQPKFDTPLNKLNEKFFILKPTLREYTSQNPYMEEFVGEPYCYTINITDEHLLRETLVKIKNMKRLPGKIPKEFTSEGMLERLHVFTERMDYCNPYAPRWPPADRLQVYFSLPGESCKDACMSKGLMCENTFFSDINSSSLIEKHGQVKCQEVKEEKILHAPSYSPVTNICYVQAHGQLFSCMHKEKDLRRLCPCRDFEKEQSAICRNCL